MIVEYAVNDKCDVFYATLRHLSGQLNTTLQGKLLYINHFTGVIATFYSVVDVDFP